MQIYILHILCTQRTEDAMVQLMFVILTTQFIHFELPLCYSMLFNLEQGHPLSLPHQFQKARDNKEMCQIMFTGSEEETSTRDNVLLLTMYNFGKVTEN